MIGLTNQKDYQVPPGVKVMHSVASVLTYAEQTSNLVFIIGGSEVFKAFLPSTDILYRTLIDAEFEGDSYFPEIDWSEWGLVAHATGKTDDKNRYPHQYEMYSRKDS